MAVASRGLLAKFSTALTKRALSGSLPFAPPLASARRWPAPGSDSTRSPPSSSARLSRAVRRPRAVRAHLVVATPAQSLPPPRTIAPTRYSRNGSSADLGSGPVSGAQLTLIHEQPIAMNDPTHVHLLLEFCPCVPARVRPS